MKYSVIAKYAVGLLLLTPLAVLAQGASYDPLVNLPGGIGDPVTNFEDFLNTIYAIAIAIAALLAVIKITIAGVKYMLSDVVTGKAAAKADIQGALFGLIIVIGAVLILNTINPQMTGGDLNSGPAVTAATRAAPPQNATISSAETSCISQGGSGIADCGVVDCQIFDSVGMGNYLGAFGTTIGYGVQATGIDYGLNSATCSARCAWLGGQRIAEGFDSGTCVYPKDPATAAAALAKSERDYILTEAGADIGSVGPDDTLRECATQAGPTACQGTEEACTSGRMSPTGQVGVPDQIPTSSLGRVIVCRYP